VKHSTWEAHLSICRKVETGGRNADQCEDAAILAQMREFIAVFAQHRPPPARILAPGAVAEALLLAEAGYEVHTLLLGPDNVKWVEERRARLPAPGLLHVREQDAHQLDYPRDYFDGYFSVQFHEHLHAPIVHVTEFRLCARDGAIAFVDACGTTNEACKMIWHVNLVPEQVVREQWEFCGFEAIWRGPHGDQRPQFVFRKLPWGHADFKNSGYLDWVRRLRSGEKIRYDYHCAECGR
jgi:hypothetical protein